MRAKLLALIVFLFLPLNLWALGFEQWLVQQRAVAEREILKNISPAGVRPGTVVASPSKVDPDYYYHWVRDASLTLLAVEELNFSNAETLLKNYLDVTRIHQKKSGDKNLGEPKYLVDGAPFTGPWGRPQNDGPALRAIVFARWANQLLEQNQESFVRANLYDGKLPSESVLKRDLEYVSHHWSEPSFDIWEEVKADHFFTLMVERKALVLGANIAAKLKDFGAAQFYNTQADLIKSKLQNFIINKKIVASINYVEGLSSKTSNLDTAVLLGLIHGDLQDGFMSFNSELVQDTLVELQSTFEREYKINTSGPRGIALGRYPEDVYYGGHAWFITTLAQAELLYKSALRVSRENKDMRNTGFKMFDEAEDVMARVQYHVPADLRLSEQFDRTSGFCLGARDLTWSYASYLTAFNAREAALKDLKPSRTQKSTKLRRR